MKENISVELKTKDVSAFNEETLQKWMDELVHHHVKANYKERNVIDELDKKIGHDLFIEMSIAEWMKYRGYITVKEAVNLDAKRFEPFGDLEQIDLKKCSVYLKTEIDFFNRHHLRFAYRIVDLHGMEKLIEFSINLHEAKHLADLTLLQLLRAFGFSVSIHG